MAKGRCPVRITKLYDGGYCSKIDEFIAELIAAKEKYSDNYEDMYVETELDSSGCYYDGDTPSTELCLYGSVKENPKDDPKQLAKERARYQ